ncbi:MAG: cytochrome b/b6 domain-containing protein [Sideroxydans sp.]
MQTKHERIKVWDLPLRLFHWILVGGFALAWLSGEVGILDAHVLIGYGLIALWSFRLVWGFVGSRFSRFRSFLFGPAETVAYIKSLRSAHPAHYYGHNPAGALMVFTLLALLGAIFVSGLLTLAAVDYEGPLLFLANAVSDEASNLFRDTHELLVDGTLLLIPLHLLGVLQGSLQHRENLVWAMVTGWKRKVE